MPEKCHVFTLPDLAHFHAVADIMPPKGLTKEGTGAAALCPCHCFLSPPIPLVEGALPIASLLAVGRLVFDWPGCVPRIGPLWKASHGQGGLAGGRRSGAAPLAYRWPLRFAVLARPRTVISARSCVKARAARSPAPLGPRLDTRSLRLATQRKDGQHKLQRPAA